MEPEDLASWRVFFKTSGLDIFSIIDNAIMVAAKDYSSHLRLRREQIVSLLYNHSCPCKRHELSVPLEEPNVSQPNADRNITYGRCCCEWGSHQDNNGRIDNVGLNLSVEQDKSVMVICNDDKQMDKPTNVEDGSNKELEAVEDADRNDGVEHQDQILQQVPAKNIAVKQSGDSILGSDGVSNKNEGNVLESIIKNMINNPQDGLNKNTTVEESSDSQNVASNGISNDKDGALLEDLNKISAGQSGGSKELSFNGTLNNKCSDLREGLYKNTAERRHCGFDGPNLLQMCGSEYEQTRGRKKLIKIDDDTTKEVVEIKKILENCQDQPKMRLLELLMKLESMDLDFKILEVTQIGKAVNAVRKYALKHGLKEIRGVASSLIRDWKTKVDEWLNLNSAAEEVHLSAEDQCPSGLLIEGITVAPHALTLDETLQAFDGLDGEDFFSILPQDNILGKLFTNGELGFTEEELLHIDTIPENFDSSVSIREEDSQQQHLPLQETSNSVEDEQHLTDKNLHAISYDSKQVKKKGDMTKLGNQASLQRVPESDGNEKRKFDSSVSIREEVPQQQPLSLQETSNSVEDEQPLTDKNRHAISNDSKQVKKKGDTTKLGNQASLQRVLESGGNRKRKFDSSVSISEEVPQQQSLPLQETSNSVEDEQPLTDRNRHAISDDSKQVKKKGDTTKLGNKASLQRVPESNGNGKRKFDSSVSIREEEPQLHPLPLQETSNFVEDKQPLTDKNRHAISDDTKQVMKKGETTKLGNQASLQRVPESNGNWKNRNATKPEQRAPKPSFYKRPENVRTSRSNEPWEVERTRRKLHERYRNVEDAKK